MKRIEEDYMLTMTRYLPNISENLQRIANAMENRKTLSSSIKDRFDATMEKIGVVLDDKSEKGDDDIMSVWFFTRQSLIRPLNFDGDNTYTGMDFKPNTGLHLWPVRKDTFKFNYWACRKGNDLPRSCAFETDFSMQFVRPNFITNLLSMPDDIREGIELPDIGFIYKSENDWIIAYHPNSILKYDSDETTVYMSLISPEPMPFIKLTDEQVEAMTINK